MKNFKAAILEELKKPLKVETVSFEQKLGIGQVFVRLSFSGICGAQINEIDGAKGLDNYLPHLLGHEGYGEVIDVGPGVKSVSEGDHVVLHWRPGTGIQSETPKYSNGGDMINAGWVTTFNEKAVVSENRLTKIDVKGLVTTQIPLLGCALTTALGILERELRINFRDRLILFGAGGVGMSILSLLHIFGVTDFIVVDNNYEKLAIAEKMGARHCILFESKEACLSILKSEFSGQLPTAAIDTTGIPECIELCYEFSSPDARISLVGVPKKGNNVSLYTLPMHFGKRIIGSHGGSSVPQQDISVILDLLRKGIVSLDSLPLTVFSLDDVNAAIDSLRAGTPGRIILEM